MTNLPVLAIVVTVIADVVLMGASGAAINK